MRRCAMVLFLVALGPLRAGAEPPPDPRATVEGAYDRIRKLVASERDDASLQAKVVPVLADLTDFREFGRLTLKKHWKDLTEAQRTHFVARFRVLVERSYVKHFKAGRPLEIRYRGDTVRRGDRALVRTTVVSGKSEADVDYKLVWRDGRWRAYDIVIDDVSLMRSYRRQFGGIFKREGFDGLMRKIERKIERGSDSTDLDE